MCNIYVTCGLLWWRGCGFGRSLLRGARAWALVPAAVVDSNTEAQSTQGSQRRQVNRCASREAQCGCLENAACAAALCLNRLPPPAPTRPRSTRAGAITGPRLCLLYDGKSWMPACAGMTGWGSAATSETGFADGVSGGASAIRLDPISVRIDHERRVVVRPVIRAQPRGTVVLAALAQSRRMELVDARAARRVEAEMQPRGHVGRGRALGRADPQHHRLVAVAERTCPRVQALVPQRRQRGVVELLGPRQITHPDRDMVEHRLFSLCARRARPSNRLTGWNG